MDGRPWKLSLPGATLLIAFAVEQAALIRALGIRDPTREAFAGFSACLGAMGVVGSGVALWLSQDAGHHSTSPFHAFLGHRPGSLETLRRGAR